MRAALVAATLAFNFQSAPPAPAPVRFQLPNGLRVWVQEDHTRPVALVQVDYKVGAINEDPGTTGTAHYVEHMVYRATQHIKNEDVYGYIDRIGGRYTGGTSRDGTSYGETVPIWALESAIETTAERMGRALFDSVEFERERNNVVTEANGFARLDPANALRDAVMLTSFELHPYRYSSNTWAQDNLAITRADAYDFYKKYYGPNNAVLTIVGDVNPAEVRRLVEKHFGSLARAPRSGEVRIVEPPQRVEKRVVLHSPGVRKQLEIVYRAPQASQRDYATLTILDQLLIRQLELAIGMSGKVQIATSQTATAYPFVYRISIAADSTADLERLAARVQAEIDAFAADPIGEGDMANARASSAQRRAGRGAAAAADVNAAVPPRQSNLTQIATELAAREEFAWEVGPAVRAKIVEAQRGVTAADISAYVKRWLRPTQRTIGFLLPGDDDFIPTWSNGRTLAGQRLEIPPLVTPPAKRTLPQPVPARSLLPLAPLSLHTSRAVLDNGVAVRAAESGGATASLAVRVALGGRGDAADTNGLALVAARVVAGDSGLAALNARVVLAPLANDGYFDIRVSVPPERLTDAMETVSRALRARSYSAALVSRAASLQLPDATAGRGRGGGGAAAAAGINAYARSLVFSIVAPAWRLTDPSSAARSSHTAPEVNAYLDRQLVGGAVTVSIVAPGRGATELENANRAFGSIPGGARPPAVSTPVAARPPGREHRVRFGDETQVTVIAGLPGVPRDNPDWRALELLNYIVGVPSYGGRLGWALTKSGLTYSSATTTTFGATAGHILISTKCDTRNTDAAIQAIREVIDGVAEHGVEEWELREAKAFTLGRMLLYGVREDSGEEAIAGAQLDAEYFGNPLLDLPAWSRAYLDITLAQINDVARRYYRPEQLAVAAVGAIPAGDHASPFAPGTFKALFGGEEGRGKGEQGNGGRNARGPRDATPVHSP